MGELMLVEEVNGEARVSSKVIAENTEREHRNVKRTIEKHVSSLEEFGKVRMEIAPSESGQSENVYFLNEDQSTLLLTLMTNKGLVLDFKKALVKAFSSLKKQAIVGMVQSAIGIKEELEIVQMTARFLNLSESATLGMLQRFYESKGLDVKLLPVYTESKGALKSASELLKEHGGSLSAIAFNKLLVAEGILEERERPSSKGVKKFKAISEKGLKYGENLQSPQNPKEVQPHWYAEKFAELLNVLWL